MPEGLCDAELAERLLKPAESTGPSGPAKPLPDWPALQEQLRRKGVTLQLLWQEYRQAHPEGYQRSQFCQLYRDWAKTLDPVLRQVHQPGQKLFVDWAGLKVPIHHADGSVTEASLFVAVHGLQQQDLRRGLRQRAVGTLDCGSLPCLQLFRRPDPGRGSR